SPRAGGGSQPGALPGRAIQTDLAQVAAVPGLERVRAGPVPGLRAAAARLPWSGARPGRSRLTQRGSGYALRPTVVLLGSEVQKLEVAAGRRGAWGLPRLHWNVGQRLALRAPPHQV